jgi:hypothetical protein
MRFVLNVKNRFHIGAEHSKYEIGCQLNTVWNHAFENKLGLAPAYLSDNFIPQDTVHSFTTRICKMGVYSTFLS